MCLPALYEDHKTAGGLGSVFCKLAGFHIPALQIKSNCAARLESGMNIKPNVSLWIMSSRTTSSTFSTECAEQNAGH